MSRRPVWRAPLLEPALLVAFVAAWGCAGWVADDALISARVVENLVAGEGPVWNPGQRVQVFTHPLWLGLVTLVRLAVGHPVVALRAASLVTAVAAVGLALAITPSRGARVALLGALIASHAFLDHAASGLETPLLAALDVVVLAVALRPPTGPRLAMACLGVGLAVLTRPDALVMLGPVLAVTAARAWRAGVGRGALLGAAGLGIAPVAAWAVFAVAYYGALLPTPALAKLGTGIPVGLRALQGGHYLLVSARHDPLSLVMIGAGILAGFRRGGVAAAVAAGVVARLLYVVVVGGDFMAGRFLATAVLVSGVLLARELHSRPRVALAGLATALLAAVGTRPVWTYASTRDVAWSSARTWGVADERGHHDHTRLLLPGRRGLELGGVHVPQPWPTAPSDDVQVVHRAGADGLHAQPARLVDAFGITDPLLARLPGYTARPGHHLRRVPPGWVAGDTSALPSHLRAYAADVVAVTEGPLAAPERWQAIARLLRSPVVPRWSRYRHDATWAWSAPVVDGVPACASADADDLHDAPPPGHAELPLWLGPGCAVVIHGLAAGRAGVLRVEGSPAASLEVLLDGTSVALLPEDARAADDVAFQWRRWEVALPTRDDDSTLAVRVRSDGPMPIFSLTARAPGAQHAGR